MSFQRRAKMMKKTGAARTLPRITLVMGCLPARPAMVILATRVLRLIWLAEKASSEKLCATAPMAALP